MKSLIPLADRAADAAIEAVRAAARARKSPTERRRRVAEALAPMLVEAAILGLDQAIIVAAEIKRGLK